MVVVTVVAVVVVVMLIIGVMVLVRCVQSISHSFPFMTSASLA